MIEFRMGNVGVVALDGEADGVPVALRVIDEFFAAHPRLLAGLRGIVVMSPTDLHAADAAGWLGHGDVFVHVVARPGWSPAWFGVILAHEVGHAWQCQHVTTAAQRATWESIRSPWDDEDYADVFAHSLGYGWGPAFPRPLGLGEDAQTTPPTEEQVDELRRLALLPERAAATEGP